RPVPGQPAHPQQLQILAQLPIRDTQLAGRLGDPDAGPRLQVGHEVEQPTQPIGGGGRRHQLTPAVAASVAVGSAAVGSAAVGSAAVGSAAAGSARAGPGCAGAVGRRYPVAISRSRCTTASRTSGGSSTTTSAPNWTSHEANHSGS